MTRYLKFFLHTAFLVYFFLFSTLLYGSKDLLPIPRFVSTKSNNVPVRSGPGVRYPQIWTFMEKNEPLKIIEEFDDWRKVADFRGDTGWIHKNFLHRKTFVVVISPSPVNVYKEPTKTSKVVGVLYPYVRCKLLSKNPEMIMVQCDSVTGYIERSRLWGV